MRRYERQFEQAAARALDRLRRDLVRGITDENVHELTTRLSNEAVTRPFQDAIVAQLQAVALAGSAFGREQVERDVFGTRKAIGVGMWELANNAAFQWAMDYGYDLVRNIEAITRERIGLEVADYIRNSQPIGTLIRRLTAGWLFSPERARLIAVTEVTRAYAEGNRQAWKASGVIEKRRWRTNADELVCPVCGPLAGQVVGLDEEFAGGISGPPAHPRCRCWVTPVVDDAVVRPVAPVEPETAPEPEPALDADGFPVGIAGLEEVRPLGGSTGAMLVRDPVTGKQYVMKRGASADHIRREFEADQTYQALGVRVPKAKLYETDGGPVKLAEFVEGKPLRDFRQANGRFPDKILGEVREGFAADALMGNWDVIGMDYDNILIDAKGKAWRIDNGGSLDFRAQGGRKTFDGYPLELWSLRDAAINRQSFEVFGGMDYGDLMKYAGRQSKYYDGALEFVSPDLRQAFRARAAQLDEAVSQYKELTRDGWRGTYVDNFTRLGMQMDQYGILGRMPKKLASKKGWAPWDLADEDGRFWDHMRGDDSLVNDLKNFMDHNGGDYGMAQYYLGQQAGNSWSKGAQSVKYWLSQQMDIDAKDVYWNDGIDAAKHLYEQAVDRFGQAKYDNSMQSYHAFTYHMLKRTDFKNNDRKKGIVKIMRTEESRVLKHYGLSLGDKGVTMSRGLAESGSVFDPVYVYGDALTIQNVPRSRILATYIPERAPGLNHTALYGDRENEFVFIPQGIKFDWKSIK